MDFLKSGLKSVLGSQEAGVQPSAADTVSFFLQNKNIPPRRRKKDSCQY